MLLKREIIENPRYFRTAKIARNFMISQKINRLPVDPFYIAESNGWPIEKASVVAKDLGSSIFYLLNRLIKSKDGAAIYCGITDEYKIIYNDKIPNPGRIRWTLMHEIGHIVLDHLNSERTIIHRGGLSKKEYIALEKEADFFAGLVLAPPIILESINVKTPGQIQKICRLSKEASKNRFNYYMRWKKYKTSSEELIIKKNFRNFIDQKCCKNCGHGFISSKALCCPICGNLLDWGQGEVKYKEGVPLDENGRAVICPQCENEDIDKGAQYCKICGAYLYQKCTGEEPCDVKLDSNARYCTQCGRKTTFFREGYLVSWEEEKQEIESLSEEIVPEEEQFDNIEVPF